MNFRELLNKLDEVDAAGLDAATAPAGATPAPAADPAKQNAYRRAQAAMANLEKAAQYHGTDEIVRSRAGLPPPLPPIEQWDGKMPAPVGRPDWFSRVFGSGGGATGDVEKDQTAAAAQNTADASTIQTAQTQLKQLADLVSKLGVKESKVNIANTLVESFGYQAEAEATLGQQVAVGAAGYGAAKGIGKALGKAIPGVGLAFGAADAYNRAKKGDWTGAGLAGLSAGLSLIPGFGWIPAAAIDMFNLGRDLRGPTADAQGAMKHPVTNGPIAQLQKAIGVEADGIFGPKSQAALKTWQQQKGLTADGIPGPKTMAAAGIKLQESFLPRVKTSAELIKEMGDRLTAIHNPEPLIFVAEDGTTCALTPENEIIELDEGIWSDLAGGVAKYGKQAWQGAKDIGRAAKIGATGEKVMAPSGKMVNQSGKVFQQALKGQSGASKAAYKAGQVVGKNPGKVALGLGAAGLAGGYAMGNNSGGTEVTPNTGGGGTGGTGGTGGQGGAETGDTVPTQTFDPAVVSQIGELMSALAQVNKATGGKPLDSLIAKPAAPAAKPELTPQQQAQNVLQPGMNKTSGGTTVSNW